jgi:hypothetical protein
MRGIPLEQQQNKIKSDMKNNLVWDIIFLASVALPLIGGFEIA